MSTWIVIRRRRKGGQRKLPPSALALENKFEILFEQVSYNYCVHLILERQSVALVVFACTGK